MEDNNKMATGADLEAHIDKRRAARDGLERAHNRKKAREGMLGGGKMKPDKKQATKAERPSTVNPCDKPGSDAYAQYSKSDRREAHRERMRNKKARDAKVYAHFQTRRSFVLPNNGNSNNIWPAAKVMGAHNRCKAHVPA